MSPYEIVDPPFSAAEASVRKGEEKAVGSKIAEEQDQVIKTYYEHSKT